MCLDALVECVGEVSVMSYWLDEFLFIVKKATGNYERVIQQMSSRGEIFHRKTVLMLGLFCDKAALGHVNFWLNNLSMDELTRRNQIDAFFIFVYEAIENFNIEDRIKFFNECLDEYFEWEYNNGSFLDILRKNSNGSYRNVIYPEISTFGELCDRVERASIIDESGKLMSTRTDVDAMEELERILERRGHLSDFFDYLINEDKTMRDYNRRSSFYLQKMIYNIIKSGVDTLCGIDLPDSYKEQYEEALAYALGDKTDSKNAFHRFIDYNYIFIKEKESFRSWVIRNRKNLTPKLCLEELKNYDLNYNAIFTSFFWIIVGERYGTIEKMFRLGRDDDAYENMSVSKETYNKIMNLKNIYVVRRDCVRDLQRFISGNKFVSRGLLILVGLIAGYKKGEINKVLIKSGYEELDEDVGFDSAAIKIISEKVISKTRDIVNSKDYLAKVTTETDKEHDSMAVGEYAREQYDECLKTIGIIFENNLTDEDATALKNVFDGEDIKNYIDNFKKKDKTILKEFKL